MSAASPRMASKNMAPEIRAENDESSLALMSDSSDAEHSLIREAQSFTRQLKSIRNLALNEQTARKEIQRQFERAQLEWQFQAKISTDQHRAELRQLSESHSKEKYELEWELTEALKSEQKHAADLQMQVALLKEKFSELSTLSQGEILSAQKQASDTSAELEKTKTAFENEKKQSASLRNAIEIYGDAHHREKELLRLELESHREELSRTLQVLKSVREKVEPAACEKCSKLEAAIQAARTENTNLEKQSFQFAAKVQRMFQGEREKRTLLENQIRSKLQQIDTSRKGSVLEEFHPDRIRLQQDLRNLQDIASSPKRKGVRQCS